MEACSRKHCTRPALWKPVILIFPKHRPDYSGPPARLEATMLPVCSVHKGDLTLADFITDDNWPSIVHVFGLMRKAEPDRSRLALDFDFIGGC